MAVPVAIVTGANTGIGFQTALALGRKGYRVVLACRSPSAGAAAAADVAASARAAGGDAAYMHLDLASLRSVRDFSAAFLASHGALHALVCNAGVASAAGVPPRERVTADGANYVSQVNFLGHFLLVQLLLPRLKATAADAPVAPCRVVLLSSVTHRLVAPPRDAAGWAAALGPRPPAGATGRYATSKLACNMYAYALQRSLAAEGGGAGGGPRGGGVVAVAVNPGAVASDIWRHVPPALMCWWRPFMRLFLLTPAQGAVPVVAAAAAGEVGGAALAPGRPWYLTPYLIPRAFQNERYVLELPSLLADALGPGGAARVARSTSASYDPLAARALVAAAADMCAAALAGGGGGGGGGGGVGGA